MTNEEIEQAIKDFGEATRRAIEAGFDGVLKCVARMIT